MIVSIAGNTVRFLKAWYFSGLQELLLHFHPLFAVLVIPAVVVGLLFLLPFIRYDNETAGVWFASYQGRRIAAVAAAVAAILSALYIVADEYIIDFAAWMPSVPKNIATGLLPTFLVLAGTTGFYWLIEKKYSVSNNEAVQALFVFMLVALIILTVTGIWFRGAGMKLIWPW
jgi:hypothetical protein